jgi:hypothetical protein
MRCLKAATALFVLLATGLANAYADDFGPRHDVGTLRSDAPRLLAHRARLANIDPKQIAISDVVVVGDQAVLSWDIGTQHGLMGLVRQDNRWWDALDVVRWVSNKSCWSASVHHPIDIQQHTGSNVYGKPSKRDIVSWGLSDSTAAMAGTHNADIVPDRANVPSPSATLLRCWAGEGEIYDAGPGVPIPPSGGPISANDNVDPYQVSITLARNDALPRARITRVYARPPTPAEFLPYPTPYRIVSDAVMFFDIVVDGPKPVSFQKGTTFDVWFPFVLDDTLKYRIVFSTGEQHIGPIVGSIFDNVVHFEVPGFTALPGKEIMGEIDGDPR